jgi:hypothetical protein
MSKIEKDRGKVENLTNAGKGRPKGALNKTTQSAKDAIAEAAQELGGATRLVEWIKEDPSNEKVFWGTIYPKLLPLQVSGEGGGAILLTISSTDADL